MSRVNASTMRRAQRRESDSSPGENYTEANNDTFDDLMDSEEDIEEHVRDTPRIVNEYRMRRDKTHADSSDQLSTLGQMHNAPTTDANIEER